MASGSARGLGELAVPKEHLAQVGEDCRVGAFALMSLLVGMDRFLEIALVPQGVGQPVVGGGVLRGQLGHGAEGTDRTEAQAELAAEGLEVPAGTGRDVRGKRRRGGK